MTPFNSDALPAADSGPLERQAQRALLRSRRTVLPKTQRIAAATAIARHIAASRWLVAQRSIGLYSSVGMEVGTGPLYALAARRRCRIFLPRIIDYRRQRMAFVDAGSTRWERNRHGILEPPPHARRIPARALSVVFVPVLAFDRHGTRLGSGAGYYDRLFAFRRLHQHWRRPLLVGLAYSCQELACITRAEHDVPLDAMVTEQGIIPLPFVTLASQLAR